MPFQRNFLNTRVILDAADIPIKKALRYYCPISYKHQITLNTMIGCTPSGAVSLISKSNGWTALDKQIIE